MAQILKNQKDNLIEILSKDIYKNINIINFIENYPLTGFDKAGDSLLVKGKSDENWIYISSSSELELIQLLENLNAEDKYFAIIEEWMEPIIIKQRDLEWKLSCMKYILPDDIDLPESKCEVAKLKKDDADYIFENYDYKSYTSPAYISERIVNDLSFGITEDDKLVGWVLTHDDGSIGLLNVLPAYRRKGYGYELMLAITREARRLGHFPFLHIEEDNIKSTELALKLGFKQDRKVSWFQIS
jgi:8-oxo-dGTP diphosphatase